MAHVGHFLLSNITIWEELLQDETKIPLALEELIRLFSPAEFVRKYGQSREFLIGRRETLVDRNIGQHTLKAKDEVVIALKKSNFDPDEFPNPKQFIINRFSTGKDGYKVDNHRKNTPFLWIGKSFVLGKKFGKT